MEFADIKELFSAFGPVDVRRMFGGAGIYPDGTMFALVADGVIYLKADDGNAAAFDRENLAPFTYATKDGKHHLTSYWRAPERLLDDTSDLVAWARSAIAAAHRAANAKPQAKRAAKTMPKTSSQT